MLNKWQTENVKQQLYQSLLPCATLFSAKTKYEQPQKVNTEIRGAVLFYYIKIS